MSGDYHALRRASPAVLVEATSDASHTQGRRPEPYRTRPRPAGVATTRFHPRGGSPAHADSSEAPLENALQIRTNPAPLGRAVVRLSVVKDEPGEVAVFDAAGRRMRVLANGTLHAGIHDLAWDGGDESGRRMPAGVYFVRVKLASSGFGQSKVLVLLK